MNRKEIARELGTKQAEESIVSMAQRHHFNELKEVLSAISIEEHEMWLDAWTEVWNRKWLERWNKQGKSYEV